MADRADDFCACSGAEDSDEPTPCAKFDNLASV